MSHEPNIVDSDAPFENELSPQTQDAADNYDSRSNVVRPAGPTEVSEGRVNELESREQALQSEVDAQVEAASVLQAENAQLLQRLADSDSDKVSLASQLAKNEEDLADLNDDADE